VGSSFQKKDIAKDLSNNIGFSKAYSIKLINDLLESIIINICNEPLYLKNFGVFKILIKKERIGRNPITKKEYNISARKTIKFKASRKLLSDINDS
tara:strand:- start:185 stop:472 length:288 start_codon:yes stop_codon:yes gene_type:complete